MTGSSAKVSIESKLLARISLATVATYAATLMICAGLSLFYQSPVVYLIVGLCVLVLLPLSVSGYHQARKDRVERAAMLILSLIHI